MHSSTVLQVHRLASQSASRSIHSRLRWQQNCGLPAAPCFLMSAEVTLKPLVTGCYTHTHIRTPRACPGTRLVSVVSHTVNEGVVERDHLAFHPPSRLLGCSSCFTGFRHLEAGVATMSCLRFQRVGSHRHVHLAIRHEQGQVSLDSTYRSRHWAAHRHGPKMLPKRTKFVREPCAAINA